MSDAEKKESGRKMSSARRMSDEKKMPKSRRMSKASDGKKPRKRASVTATTPLLERPDHDEDDAKEAHFDRPDDLEEECTDDEDLEEDEEEELEEISDSSSAGYIGPNYGVS